MPFTPNAIERSIFYTFNAGPAPLLDIFNGLGLRVILTAHKLRVFDALAGGPMEAQTLAARLGTDERGTRLLLSALVPLGYVARKRDGTYANTRLSAKWMISTSDHAMTSAFDFWGRLLPEFFHNLEQSIQEGKPPADFYAWLADRPDLSAAFQQYMVAIARLTQAEVLAKAKLPRNARRLLDLGGGHGMYAIAYAKKHAGLEAIVFDAPVALESARRNVHSEGLDARVTLQGGDFLRDDLPGGQDAVLLFNVVHGLPPEDNERLLARVWRALNPGGRVIILEQLEGKAPGPASLAASQLIALAYHHLLGGRVYAANDLTGWLKGAGFASVNLAGLLKAPGNYLVTGTKPA